MLCNHCSFEITKQRIAKAKRKLLLRSGGDWIEVWSYALDSCGNPTDMRDEECGYLGLTLHCSCDED